MKYLSDKVQGIVVKLEEEPVAAIYGDQFWLKDGATAECLYNINSSYEKLLKFLEKNKIIKES